MKEATIKVARKERRARRIRRKIMSVSSHPRLSIFRSNNFIYAQIIDDKAGKTLVSVSEKEVAEAGKETKTARAEKVGQLLAQKAKKEKVTKVTFDKGAYKYHGRVKAFADGARKEGLEF